MNLLGLFGKQKPKRGRPVLPAPVLPECAAEEYEAGDSVLDLCIKYKTDTAKMRAHLVSLGVTIRPRGQVPGFGHHTSKLTTENITWILEQDDKNVTHAEIARHVNVTRERVRQICLANGKQVRRERMTKTLAVREAREAKKIQRRQRIEMLADKWNAGMSLAELVPLLGAGSIQAAQSRICNYRKLYPGLFNLRRPNHWHLTRKSADERYAYAVKLAELWNTGVATKDIAERLGYTSRESAYASLAHHRYRHPELFSDRPPGRRSGRRNKVVVSERMLRISTAWIAGEKAQDIARREGYERYRSVYNAIRGWRHAHPELFPPRRTGRARSVLNGTDAHTAPGNPKSVSSNPVPKQEEAV